RNVSSCCAKPVRDVVEFERSCACGVHAIAHGRREWFTKHHHYGVRRSGWRSSAVKFDKPCAGIGVDSDRKFADSRDGNSRVERVHDYELGRRLLARRDSLARGKFIRRQKTTLRQA